VPLERRDFEVHGDIVGASTLPACAFTDPEFLEAELATIFQGSWLFVPERTSAELHGDLRSLPELTKRRGACAPFTLLDKPLFLQRDWQGALRAFPNVCTHAWHTLVQGPDRQRHITCPQHGRQFDCAGTFQSQPGFDAAKGFPRAEDHLKPIKVAEWAGLLFAALGKPAAPFGEAFGPVAASVGGLGVERYERRPLAAEVRELAGNWKQHAWNYLDSLHIPYIHRKPGGLADAVDLDSYRTELYGASALQWAYARDPAHGFAPESLPKRFAAKGKRVFALWWFVWPNLTLNFYPWGLSVNVYEPVRGKPERTRFLWYHHVADAKKYAERDAVWKMREVDDEDVDALGQVMRGALSGMAPRGRFAPGKEEGPHWFHRKVFEQVFGLTPAARVPPAPAPRAAKPRRGSGRAGRAGATGRGARRR
jgi:phenylpropionate dioxygenase-like ring-hydroxylating dioxygenase large terminal subunit